MRRPALYAVLLSLALLAVLYGKSHLDSMIKEGKLDAPATDAEGPQNTIDIGGQPTPEKEALQEAPTHATGSTHQDIMGALVEARQAFRNKENVSTEVAANPHTTPDSIIKSAEKLGDIITLEQAHPEYKAEFQAFYLDCAKDLQVITVTRVQCLEKYIKSKQLNEDEEKKLLTDIDPIVKKLYLEIK